MAHSKCPKKIKKIKKFKKKTPKRVKKKSWLRKEAEGGVGGRINLEFTCTRLDINLFPVLL